MPTLMPSVHAAINQLPARAQDAVRNAVTTLADRFNDVLDQSGPLLLTQARNLGNEKQKEQFLVGIDECRRYRSKIHEAFQLCIANAVGKLAEKSVTTAPVAAHLKGSQFSLVEEDDLQERITLQTIVSNANASYDFQLDQINSGLGKLLPDVRISNQNNPLSPNAIGEYIHAAFTAIMIAQPVRIAMYKLCKDAIFNSLLPLYQSLLRDMLQSGINVQVRAAWSSDIGENNADAVDLYFGQGKKKDAPPAPAAKPAAAAPVTPAIAKAPVSVSELLKRFAQPAPTAAAVGGDLSSPQHLLNARLTAKTLGNDDLKPWFSGWMKEKECPTDLRTSIRERLKKYSTSHTVMVITPEADNTLKFVANLYQALHAHANPALASALGRWQMLLAALCLDDADFLDNTDQPPLQLLDLALKLTLGANQADKRITQRVLRCLLQAIDEFEENPLVFHDLVTALEKLEQKESDSLAENLKNTQATLHTQANRLVAFQSIDRFITERFSHLKRHLVFHELMHQEWRLILSEAFLEGGESGEPWKKAVALFDEIMLSLQSRGTDEDRNHLKKNLPTLATGIKALFSKYSIDDNAFQSFADALAEIQRKVLQGIDVSSLLDSDLLCSDEVRTILEHIDAERASRYAETLTIGADHTQHAALSTAPLRNHDDCPLPAQAEDLLNHAAQQSWWIFVIDGEACYCKYHYYFAARDKLVFVDRGGNKLFERTRRDIINDIASGYAMPALPITGIADAIARAIESFA